MSILGVAADCELAIHRDSVKRLLGESPQYLKGPSLDAWSPHFNAKAERPGRKPAAEN